MEEIFKNAKFKYKFRNYQQRALDEVHKYMSDKKINVIAAPGAGKTILAIQLMIELGESTLILAPTIALCEQWKERLTDDFVFEGIDIRNYISDDIYNPNVITISTYQSLYSVYRKKSEKSKDIDIIELLNKVNLKTIILDEAHHLKTAWHEATNSILNKMTECKVISLTATPPYDTDKLLWNKYIELCGEPDTEVTVAELVKNKNLAPHQDFICFNTLEEEQIRKINEYNIKIKEFIKQLLINDEFIMSLATHNMIVNPNDNVEYILENFEYYIAVLKILQLKDIDINGHQKFNVNKYTLSVTDIENVLTYMFFKDKKSYKGLKTIKSELNELGAVLDNKVCLKYTKDISEIITENVGKLKSVEEIIKTEKLSMGNKLKAVVIVENIIKDALEMERQEINSIGAIPVFKCLSENNEVIVLTGEIVLIPTTQKELLLKICAEEEVFCEDIIVHELAVNFDYLEVKFAESKKKKMVGIITKLFEEANINILIGTNALIGEGWDAPFINTLIIASSIAAYVTSNQIRGRAIRIDKKEPDKCANIWHLVSMEKGSRENFVLGKDYEILERRFQGFEGVNLTKNEISYGIERLGIEKKRYTDNDVKMLNNVMVSDATQRMKNKSKWETALTKYTPIRRNKIEKIMIDNLINIPGANNLMEIYNRLPGISYSNLYGTELSVGFYALLWCTLMLGIPTLLVDPVAALIVFLPLLSVSLIKYSHTILYKLKNVRMLINKKYNFEILAEKLLLTLKQCRIINKKAKLKFDIKNMEFYLRKADVKENSIFRQGFYELLSPIDSPRYVITNGKRVYQVPAIIGKNKNDVKILHENIFGKLPRGILYTKTPESKELLLKIKMYQEKLFENNLRIDILDNDIIREAENKKVDISSTQIDVQVMKDVLESKNLIEEE
ncbi:MAG: DEAD/DEAH box helicase [Clostridiales bacterium]|nr:DEAD/DEAH box helicase [Clostridiales bacterium]